MIDMTDYMKKLEKDLVGTEMGDIPTYPVLFASCDDKYFMEHAGPFVFSAAEHGHDVHINIINPKPETITYASYLQAMIDTRLTFTQNSFNIDDDVDPEVVRVNYACSRFFLAPQLLSYCKKLLILDIDCLIMKPFEFPERPVAFFPRTDNTGAANEWEQRGMKVAAGAVYFDERAGNVCVQVAKTIESLPPKWFVDQIALSEIMGRVPLDAIAHFNSDFMDWEFREGTTIWTGKGPRKYENQTYLDAKKKYDRFDEIMENTDNVILKPRLDLTFKPIENKFVLKTENLDSEIAPIRVHWKNFIDKMSSELDNCLVVEAPRWWFTPLYTDYKDTTFYVPHVEKAQWGGGDNCRYYMQTVFPWLFTTDTIGWAGGSAYKDTFDASAEYDETVFDELQTYINEGGTKFAELQVQSNWEYDDKYILVPLQLPHDETIKYHSDVTVPEMVKAIAEWADSDQNTEGYTVVFKGHPVNLSAMVPVLEILDHRDADYKNSIYVDDSPIQPMMKNASSVWVINSGTGQEAMLYEKPVVTFGRCDYEGVTIHGDIDDIQGTLEKVLNDDHESRVKLYKKWFGWFKTVTVDSRPQ
jgi:hypothetical protein